MPFRRIHRSDDSQPGIIRDLRRAGVLVWVIGRPCDLLCLRGHRYYLLDCPRTRRSSQRDEKQLEQFAQWEVVVVKDSSEALRAVGL